MRAFLLVISLLVHASAASASSLAYDPLHPPPAPLEAAAPPAVYAEPDAAQSVTIALRNTGAKAVHVQEVLLLGAPGFSVPAVAPQTVAPGKELKVAVTWKPPGAEKASTLLVVRTTEGVATVALSGGVGAAPPAAPPSAAGGIGGIIGPKPSTGTAPKPAGQAVLSDPIIMGALDRSKIDEVIQRALPKIRYCYQRVQTVTPDLTGTLTVKFTIGQSGDVTAAGVKSTSFPSGDVERCVVMQFDDLRFPKPKGGGIVIVSYPFVFAPTAVAP